jgi:lipid-A-disaccharide synthase
MTAGLPTIALVAAEESGDRLGAGLMRALRAASDRSIRFIGVGGRAMSAEGLPSALPIEDLAIIGFAAIPKRLPAILRHIRSTARLVAAARPDALVIIDSPDFTHRVAARVRAAEPSIPIIDYVSPTVWAWRPGRARVMRRYVDHVLALLPFEPAAHQRLGGPPCTYVGHPLLEDLPQLRPGAEETRRRSSQPPLVLVLPGSRTGEINRMLTDFGAAIALAAEAGPIEVVLPTVGHLHDRVAAATAAWPMRPRIVVEPDAKRTAFRSARAALAKSGTVTLELALAGVPTVAAYKVSRLEELVLRRMIHLPSVILPNLILEENVIPEYLQRDCTPRNLADALLPLVAGGAARDRQLEAFAKLDARMATAGMHPSDRAAEVLLRLIAPGDGAVRGPAM